jgi:DNA-binding NarL/FixJ family response regulator
MSRVKEHEIDAVGLVELAYDLDAQDLDWLNALVVAARPGLDRGLGMFGMTAVAGAFSRPLSVVIGDSRFAAISAELNTDPSPALVRAFTTATTVSTMRRMLAPLHRSELARWDRVAGTHGVRDMIGILAHDGEGGTLNLAAASPRTERITPFERERWSRIAAHVGAALRMRRRLSELPNRVEAVLSRSGKVEHLSVELHDDHASTHALREATRNMARARGGKRGEGNDALALWPSMVSGRWTLVERAKHVEALENIPRRPPFADLAPIERACVELVRRGHGNKQIAYALGLSTGTVGSALSRAMRKLGVRTRVELISLGDVICLDTVARVLGPRATRAEIAVAALATTGLSNREIANQRRVSVRTVANQLASVFERVGVGSRAELAAMMRPPTK